jgi:outer membrane protein TolC
MDVVQAEMDLADSTNDVTAARTDAAAARIDLNTLLGRAPDAPLTLADDFGMSPLPPAAAVLAQATAENADLHVLDRRLAEATARRDLAKAMQVPDVTAGAGLALNAAPEFNYGWRTAFTMTVPLFTRHQAGVAVEEAELARLRAEREAIVANLTGAVAAALARAGGARERLTNFQTNILPRALDLQAKADDAYRSGQTSIGAMLQALQQARDVRARGLQAGLDYQLALADLERAMGTAIK